MDQEEVEIWANDPGFIFLFPKILPTYYHHLNQSFGYVLPYLYLFFIFEKCVHNTHTIHVRRICDAKRLNL